MSSNVPEVVPHVEKSVVTTPATETKRDKRRRERAAKAAPKPALPVGAEAPQAPAEDTRRVARDLKFTAHCLRELLTEMDGFVQDLEAQVKRVKQLGPSRGGGK